MLSYYLTVPAKDGREQLLHQFSASGDTTAVRMADAFMTEFSGRAELWRGTFTAAADACLIGPVGMVSG